MTTALIMYSHRSGGAEYATITVHDAGHGPNADTLARFIAADLNAKPLPDDVEEYIVWDGKAWVAP